MQFKEIYKKKGDWGAAQAGRGTTAARKQEAKKAWGPGNVSI